MKYIKRVVEILGVLALITGVYTCSVKWKPTNRELS